ncbi:molybdenum cofactor guanylyltransferase [Aquibacillus rhizosphaerae]|uniref:Probable molybdenum cofactor guanylyltransferase n=1 Tax=Aquibacillus rhizosphaerae TaxID=3051431 RepID=A0ABT7LBJ6_9BACI|nr:molybdenum cofactor guanylyltransferase [Aquibacillus sp. LR5S19]MDL4841930.1 molybdenum cofactor guanylyltransferase [Aquibacillus sp. LR5S19]
MNNIVGIVLAGGQSRRFGTPKAFAEKDGVFFYQYSIEALKPFSSSVLIVTSPKLQDSFKIKLPFCYVITDSVFQGHGPLAGLCSAMEEIRADWYFVLPTDVPFIEKWVIEQLISHINENSQAIVPTVNGRNQPLIALYSYESKKIIEHQLRHQKRSLNQLLSKLSVKYVEIEDHAPFININRKNDYELYINKSIE